MGTRGPKINPGQIPLVLTRYNLSYPYYITLPFLTFSTLVCTSVSVLRSQLFRLPHLTARKPPTPPIHRYQRVTTSNVFARSRDSLRWARPPPRTRSKSFLMPCLLSTMANVPQVSQAHSTSEDCIRVRVLTQYHRL